MAGVSPASDTHRIIFQFIFVEVDSTDGMRFFLMVCRKHGQWTTAALESAQVASIGTEFEIESVLGSGAMRQT